ncbi:MAG: acyl CoA:acetate/3-ketoacid CoA transferase [Geminicoccaceae bacterium]
MKPDKVMSADATAGLIRDRDTVGLIGGGSGLCEATMLHQAIERRFLQSGRPRNLTCVHALGIGDRDSRGMNCFAHVGLVRRVIGGHWVWSPRMQEMARNDEIEAYVLPGGVIMQLAREIAAGRPGLFTHVGLGTFADPRQEGGRLNARARDDLVDLVEIDGRELLRYRPFPIDIALLKGSVADREGNISLNEEPANLDIYAMASAAHNSGGKVIAQVRELVETGRLPARAVRVPGALVDAVVVDPEQRQSYDIVHDPSLSGEERRPWPDVEMPLDARQVIARRAALEPRDGAVINFGFGVPDAVAALVAARGETDRYYQTIEHGTYGGELLTGTLFGYARNPSAMIDAPSQFDFHSGGGLDIAFLGFGEIDRKGNVNASKLGGLTVGPGGFVDIAQTARKVVFCGSFDAKGATCQVEGGRLTIETYGQLQKIVEQVAQITFSGEQAMKQRQEILYVTERAVFRLVEGRLSLEETAPGVDPDYDVLARMAFEPLVADCLQIMPEACFLP